jgi:hypothetical protein
MFVISMNHYTADDRLPNVCHYLFNCVPKIISKNASD